MNKSDRISFNIILNVTKKTLKDELIKYPKNSYKCDIIIDTERSHPMNRRIGLREHKKHPIRGSDHFLRYFSDTGNSKYVSGYGSSARVKCHHS